jgi:type IV secretory pathway VirB4 component
MGLLDSYLDHTFSVLEHEGTMAGIELSEFNIAEKKQAAAITLEKVSAHLRKRKSSHVIYVVLDECWNFLRDEPALVQQAFREFRKLNGAAIAITQSLSDFLRDESGQSIVQNAPIRILLRQGEDMAPYRGALGLNDVEVQRLRELRQVKGEYSECLIKTPYMSRIARLHPTEAEHALLRTDNLREEFAAEAVI